MNSNTIYQDFFELPYAFTKELNSFVIAMNTKVLYFELEQPIILKH